MRLNERIESQPPEMQAELIDIVEIQHQKQTMQKTETTDKSIAEVKRLMGLGKEIW